MERCRCGRDQRPGEAWCPACGGRFRAEVAGLGPGVVPPPRRPGTVVAAQVVLALGAAGNAILALIGVVALFGALSIASSTYVGSGSETATLIVAGLVVLVYCAAATAFDIWAALAVGKGNRTARMLVTVVPAAAILVDIVVFMALADSAAQAAVTIVLSVPHAAALAILVWVPDASRRHFGDPVATPAVPSGPIPAPYPIPSRPVATPAGLSFTQNPMPVPAPRPAPASDDAVTVTLPARPRSSAPTLIGTATPPGGRHRIAP